MVLAGEMKIGEVMACNVSKDWGQRETTFSCIILASLVPEMSIAVWKAMGDLDLTWTHLEMLTCLRHFCLGCYFCLQTFLGKILLPPGILNDGLCPTLGSFACQVSLHFEVMRPKESDPGHCVASQLPMSLLVGVGHYTWLKINLVWYGGTTSESIHL